MLERLIDGLKKSASRAEEFVKAEDKDKPGLFVDFIEGIKVAAGSAHQLGHAQENPKWLDMRDILENIVTISYTLPQRPEEENSLWLKVKTFLEQLVVQTRTLANMGAMKRSDVLLHLDERSRNADKLN